MSLRRNRLSRARRVSLDISALIDVVFLLLLFFAVTTTFLEQPGIELDLPESTSAESTPPQQLQLFVDAQGKIFLKDDPIELEKLEPALAKLLSEKKDKQVILSADEKVDHGLVVKLMDAARSAGATGLAISTTPN